MTEKKQRSDRLRTRKLLLDVMGRMLEEKGLDFSLPDLARESGVATATVYRHFTDLSDLREEFYHHYIGTLIDDLQLLATHYRGRRLVHEICSVWVASAMRWARAATFIRSPEGFIERLQMGDPFIDRLYHRVLVPAIEDLIVEEAIPSQDPRYAALIWITLFDERVIVDLTVALGWTTQFAADRLESSVLGALQSIPPEPSRLPHKPSEARHRAVGT